MPPVFLLHFRLESHHSSQSTLNSERERDVGESFHPQEVNRELDAPHATNMTRQHDQVGHRRRGHQEYGPSIKDVRTKGGWLKNRHSKGCCVNSGLKIWPECGQGGRGLKIPKIKRTSLMYGSIAFFIVCHRRRGHQEYLYIRTGALPRLCEYEVSKLRSLRCSVPGKSL